MKCFWYIKWQWRCIGIWRFSTSTSLPLTFIINTLCYKAKKLTQFWLSKWSQKIFWENYIESCREFITSNVFICFLYFLTFIQNFADQCFLNISYSWWARCFAVSYNFFFSKSVCLQLCCHRHLLSLIIRIKSKLCTMKSPFFVSPSGLEVVFEYQFCPCRRYPDRILDSYHFLCKKRVLL